VVSRATVRAQVAAYLAPPASAVPFLSAVIPHPPKVTNENIFDLGAANGTGAIIYLVIRPGQKEKRIAIGGAHNGRKWRTYPFTLLCFLRSTEPKSETVGADNDTFIDALCARIEADRTFNTNPGGGETLPGMIFQAAEGSDDGGDDLVVNVDMPRLTKGQLTEYFTTVEFDVVEILNT
jgi:hypothetical protein